MFERRGFSRRGRASLGAAVAWRLSPVLLVAGLGCGTPASEPNAPLPEANPADVMIDRTSVRPFEIDIPDAVLEDLRARLGRTRLPD